MLQNSCICDKLTAACMSGIQQLWQAADAPNRYQI